MKRMMVVKTGDTLFLYEEIGEGICVGSVYHCKERDKGQRQVDGSFDEVRDGVHKYQTVGEEEILFLPSEKES